ncbi:MAG: HNH endonuclease [Desulfuromonadaceae bacterium]|nr:HNH endonuclease [Desulfuromonadaceae bacterium]
MDFNFEVDEVTIRREREKARALRKQGWWQNRIAKGVCHYCEKSFPPKELTLDHIVPLARGGRSTKGNCVPACKECNNRKKDLLPLEWEEYLQHLKDAIES